MAAAKIVISIDKDGKEDISVENFNVNYLPAVLGRLVGAVIEDKLMTGDLSDQEKQSFKRIAVEIFAKQLGVSQQQCWISLAEKEPDDEGPFLCREKGRPTIYHDMYFDKVNKIFGTKEGTGYSFITDWYPYPKG